MTPARLIAATAIEAALVVASVGLWGLVLRRFDGASPAFGSLLRVWVQTALAKYLPGSVWPLVTTAARASAIGVSPVFLSASFVVHGLLTVLGALVVAAVFVGVPIVAAVAGVAVALPLVHPAPLNRVLALAARWTKGEAPRWQGRWTDGVALVALHGALWTGFGGAFALFVSAVAPVGIEDAPRLVGAHALSFVAGFVAVFAPGGVGVREAALAGLLAPVLPVGVGLVLAAASRLWLMVAEALVGVLAFAVVGRPEGGAGDERVEAERVSTGHGLSRGNRVEPLLDSATALSRIAMACRGAQRSIRISQLAFDVDCRSAAGTTEASDERLVDALRAAAAGGAGVRVLLNGSILMNTATALGAHFADVAAVEVRGVSAFPHLQHAKLVVVDDAEAFLVGSPFVNGYWDDGQHRPLDPRRPEDDLAGRPIHDLSARVVGPVVAELAAWFDAMWDGAGAPARTDRGAAAPPREPEGTTVQVLRSRPPGLLGPADAGETEILAAYLDAIRTARSTIYLENQYFSSRPVRAALAAALAAHPDLEVILVLNQNPDITAYRSWQNRRLAEAGLLGHPRVGVFSLWAAATGLEPPHRPEVTQLFIHSKVAVIDDAWATLGTANLDGVSLDSYGDDFSMPLLRRVFRPVRNVDLNLALFDGAQGEPRTGAVRELRETLWARHLGIDPGERPPDGWLSLWRERAARHVQQLAAGTLPDGHVLPYTTRPRPRTQLRALGIDPEAAGLDLRFDPSWVEVLWSPGWLVKTIPEPIRRRVAAARRRLSRGSRRVPS